MMRSLFSAVSGLKTHQTRMDVIGNNIANVNTEAFKASSARFSELMYQTLSSASGGNGAYGTGGTNAKQIGLGVSMASTMINITGAGSSESTGNAFDLKLTDSQTTNFFIVSDGTNTMFTRAGSFYVDGNGYLCMSSTGYVVQGWQVAADTGEIRKDVVSPLQVMSPSASNSAPEATTKAEITGVLDKEDSNLNDDEDGYVMTLGFYDDLGYNYTAKFKVTKVYNTVTTQVNGQDVTTTSDSNLSNYGAKYHITLTDVLDSDGKSIIVDSNGKTLDEGGDEQTIYDKLAEIWGDGTVKTSKETQDAQGQTVTVPVLANGYDVYYDSNKGTFISIGGTEAGGTGTGTGTGTGGTTTTTTYQLENASSSQVLKLRSIPSNYGSSDDGGISLLSDTDGDITSNFRNITIDLSESTNYSNGGKSSYRMEKGDSEGDGTGKKLGALIGLAVDSSGKIYGSYDNGNTELLGQIAVAQFANASGLEKVGNNCYQTTLNSGEFDGIGVEVDADGSSINSGQLEMSNVDLSSEFTNMIITQRGFQANSRVITVSDTLLEELINLKR